MTPQVAVLGLGLIGGSVALAARRRLGAEVRGWDPDPDALRAARDRGAVSEQARDEREALEGAAIAFVCAPVDRLPEAVEAALRAAGEDCVVTDAGSVKQPVARFAADPRFVGGHPLAGAEAAGVRHAREDLFQDATWYLTPAPSTSGILFERLHRALAAIGARPAAIEPDVHDRVMAVVSHLPHVLANVLVGRAASALGGEEGVPATGPSFRDATRVAGANPPLWAGIYAANREALADELDGAIDDLVGVRDALRDGAGLEVWQRAAADDRRRLLEAGLAGGPVSELRVAVPNRPGVIADIALTLGRAGINIRDMALSPSPDMSQGVVALWCAEEQAGRAHELLAGLGLPVT